MGSHEDLERRVAALEAEMADVRTLAAGADADVSRFDAAMRGQTRVLNALRETQAEHGQRLDRIDGRLDGMDSRFDAMDSRFDRLDGGIEAILRILNGRFFEGPAPA
ncbi:MAG TPA: hypothetical protein VMZ00_02655 [Sporichthya sp.]|nr:hypothetical protein [Sporichthya sp.]